MENNNIERPSLVGATIEQVARTMADVLWNKQAVNTALYKVGTLTVIADYYIICSGRSSTHVKALADELIYEMGLRGIENARIEGRDGAAWVLVDFGNVIVHIFDTASRDYYHLEHLIGEEQRIPLDIDSKEN